LLAVYENGTRCAKSEREEYARKIIALFTDEAVKAVQQAEILDTVKKPSNQPKWVTRKGAIKAIQQLAVTANSGE
jgi:hypothetical protein